MIKPEEVYNEFERNLIGDFRKKLGLPPLGSDWAERIVVCPRCHVEHKYHSKYYADTVRRNHSICTGCRRKEVAAEIRRKNCK